MLVLVLRSPWLDCLKWHVNMYLYVSKQSMPAQSCIVTPERALVLVENLTVLLKVGVFHKLHPPPTFLPKQAFGCCSLFL
jgi:hypothetical protein